MNNHQVNKREYKPGRNSAFDSGLDAANEYLDESNLSISGDLNMALGNNMYRGQEDSDLENYYASSEMTLSALCENDGWEAGYDY